jgi:hypothetical protein
LRPLLIDRAEESTAQESILAVAGHGWVSVPRLLLEMRALSLLFAKSSPRFP